MDSNNFGTENNNNTNTDNNPYVQNVQAPNPQPVYQQEGQPVYQQPVYQQPIQQPGQQPVYQQTYYPPQEPPVNKKLEKLLCFLSLGLYISSPILSVIPAMIYNEFFSDLITSTDPLDELSSSLSSSLTFLGSAAYIAAWVLMIIARVKFKKSVFAKVLMWVYIGLLILSVVVVIILVVSCINALKSCKF